MSDSINPPNWYDGFPAPRSTAPLVSREAVLSQLYSQDLLLIDVRRMDYEGGTIAGSLNLPAQSFFQNRETLYNLCKRAGVKKVAFYCGSSRGRGARCAAWFADYISENGETADYIDDTEDTGVETTDIQSLTLEGGIKGWVKAGGDYTLEVDGYEPKYWKQFDEPAKK